MRWLSHTKLRAPDLAEMVEKQLNWVCFNNNDINLVLNSRLRGFKINKRMVQPTLLTNRKKNEIRLMSLGIPIPLSPVPTSALSNVLQWFPLIV